MLDETISELTYQFTLALPNRIPITLCYRISVLIVSVPVICRYFSSHSHPIKSVQTVTCRHKIRMEPERHTVKH